MEHFIAFTQKDCELLTKKRKGETKFGEQVQTLNQFTNIYDAIVNLDVTYVIFGIAEAVGVYANYGKTGTEKAWQTAIKALLNTQHNAYNNANKVLILGHLEYDDFEIITNKKPTKQNIKEARNLVEVIDKDVAYLVSSIIKAGKVPIIIGGGHNNAYGNIKGAALAYNEKINAINFDAHTDFRAEEGRHSGNGFSYAFAEGFLKRYFIFGLHENYTSKKILAALKKIKGVKYNTYESIAITEEQPFKTEMETALQFVSSEKFGIEIDCDAIQNIPSSAQTPSGFFVTQARQFVHHFGKHQNATYLHICEAAPITKTQTQVGKLISFLITDFIRAHESANS